MTQNEIDDFIKYYRRYYTLKHYKDLAEALGDEFGKIPLSYMKAALRKWSRTEKGQFQPTMLELKEMLWRIKLVAIAKLFDSDQNEKYNAEKFSTHEYIEPDPVFNQIYKPEDIAKLSAEERDELINGSWIIHDTLKPVLSAAEKQAYIETISILNIGLDGFNEQYEAKYEQR